MRNTRAVAFAAAMIFLPVSVSVADAAQWPDEEKIITVIVPHEAGGGTDAAIRPLVDEMRPLLSARIQIVNIGGAGSAKGTNEFLNLPNDGYTLFVAGTHTIGATMQGLTKGYLEMEHVVGLNWDPFIAASLKTRSYNTMAGMIQTAKAKPGTVCLGNAGMGGATGVASVALNLTFDNVFNVTPFNGGQNLRADVLGGRCDVGIFSQSEILSNSNVLQPLAILHENHSLLEELKSVPTMKESGFTDLEVPGGSFRSIAVRTGTPENVKIILAETFNKAFHSPSYQAFMAKQGIIPAFTKLDQTQIYFDNLVKGYEPIVKASGLYKK